MPISKSTRHSKIVGDFGEHLVCNWLSRSGFEVTIVDHTGIDVLAYNKEMNRRLGISVKSRTRLPRLEDDSVILFKKEADRKSLEAACVAFGCEPWLAVYVESESDGNLFLIELSHYQLMYSARKKMTQSWSMRQRWRTKYIADPEVMHLHIAFKETNWWAVVTNPAEIAPD